jgi:tRNA threonylcarbamoyladenosine dehydratase
MSPDQDLSALAATQEELAGVDELRRFGGLARLYGVDAAKAIADSHVAVVGIGGVGSWAAEALARSGVRQLTLIDMDHVAESNINRQIHALTHTVGQAKVLAMRERIAAIHPRCVVHGVDDFVTPDNWPGLLPGAVDGVIDACDAAAAKVAMACWARAQRVPLVMVGAAGGKLLAHRVDIDDLSRVTHDPLLARVRYLLRRHHGAPREGRAMGVTCVFSREPVAAPDASCATSADGTLNCHGYGSLVGVTATFGMCAATEMINRLASRNRSQGQGGR